ncbi:hypothetical protein FN976_16765 [Caenimonas sedimenti]|uniref:Uncharacterized protein n=1 Tax=Caenimonas sedimenti TaxID=2596921 RepID=A0A562ZNQ8_9BURK|nr:hypothetical protein FN976_16765 [Caenimonas sedimenti]
MGPGARQPEEGSEQQPNPRHSREGGNPGLPEFQGRKALDPRLRGDDGMGDHLSPPSCAASCSSALSWYRLLRNH